MPPQTTKENEIWFHCPKGPMVLGEGPIYRSSDSTLHWFDCLSEPPELYILPVDPETGRPAGEARMTPLADSVTVALFRKSKPGSYIAAYYQGVCFLDEQTGTIDVVKEIIPTSQREERRFNDGGVDAKGRFWLAEIDKKAAAFGAGRLPESYGRPKGRLWRYDPDGSLHSMLDGGLVCGNGLAWSPDNRTLYLNDSVAMQVFAFDFDLDKGNISNQRLLIDRRDSFGEPDGMVVDTQGNLWIAVYASHRVMVFSPTGEHLRDIVFPATSLACTTWGGKNHDILYIASGIDRSENPDPEDKGGHMFMHRPLNAKGQPKHEFGG